MDPKMLAKMKAFQQLQDEGGAVKPSSALLGQEPPAATGQVAGVPVSAAAPVVSATPPTVEMPETTITAVKPKEPWGAPMGGDTRGVLQKGFEGLGEGASDVLKYLGDSVMDIPENLVNAKRLLGGKPKLTGVTPPKGIEVSKESVAVVPASSRKKRSFWKQEE